jgi:hypothetical protein
LKLKYYEPLSNVSFNVNVRRYIGALTALRMLNLEENELTSVPAELGGVVQVDSTKPKLKARLILALETKM